MDNVRIELNHASVAALLRSGEVQADLQRRAAAVAAAAGPGFGTLNAAGRRARVIVFTDTVEAMIAEAHDRALMRAIDAGRG